MAVSALLGAVATVIQGHGPGNLLGAFVLAGTLIACLSVRARAVRLIIPAPTLSYVPAAMIAGAIHDRATDTSNTMDLLNAGSWIANGFLMMALATAAAIVFTLLRLFLDWRYHPQPESPASRYPRPRPVGDDWDATRRLGPDPADDKTRPVGQLDRPGGQPDQTRPGGQPTETRPGGQAGWDHTRPNGASVSTATGVGTGRSRPAAGPNRSPDTDSYRSQDTGPRRSPDPDSYRSQDTGPRRSADADSYRQQGRGPYQAQSAPVRRRAIGPAPTRPPETGPYQPQEP